jgi:putative acetyltransferase
MGAHDRVPQGQSDVISIRPERADEHDAIRAVTDRAFGTAHGVGPLVDALRDGPARASLVADDDGAVVGHVMLSRGWVDAPDRLVEVLILSPLSVDPPHQNAGIGGTLVRSAIDEAARLGTPALFLEGSPRYYPRFGFRAGGELGFTRPSVRIPEPAFQVVLLDGYEPSIAGALVYPEAFWAHDAVGLR